MLQYTSPEMEVLQFRAEDILASSGFVGGDDGPGGGDDDGGSTIVGPGGDWDLP